DDVERRMHGERRLHLFARVGLEPLHVGVEDDVDRRALDTFAKTRVAVLAGRRGHETFELDELETAPAGAAQLDGAPGDPGAGGLADLLVVGADESGELV